MSTPIRPRAPQTGGIGSTGAPVVPRGSRGSIPYGSAAMIAVVRICPECNKEYQDLHPPGDCKHGTVERIMET